MSDEFLLITSDRRIGPEQYLYVETHAWWMGTFGSHVHLTEHRLREWVPARTEREWMLERELTGAQLWLHGSAEQARDEGFDLRDVAPVGRFTAPHGRYDFTVDADDPDEPPLCAPSAPPRGSWQSPTPAFFADLPLDADVLRARLVEENPGSWFGPFTAAVTALRTGLVPAKLRSVFFEALLGLPDVSVAGDVLDVDGRDCTAIVHDAGRTRTELLVSPVDGHFAGERDALRGASRCGLPAGTVISSTSVTTAVADVIGQAPTGWRRPQ